ncbi:NUDIX hydrolase [Betaproteobacteria bacterium]|nr:NUDIX hydrolase [Betaproteobacteria bacterium]GHU14018.1 NUDIX hydrolase [Betaproteobacteria bacterium]GHU45279.1 NUDIX hydrolase [Betaproteobacteria bacterium]
MTRRISLTETQLASRVVFQGKLLKVLSDRVRLPNGAESVREHIVHPGAALILAQLPDGALLFERQFRYPLKKTFLELPAGKLDAGETPQQAAIRELAEETGYAAKSWRHLGVIHPCIGYSDEGIEIFHAHDLKQVAGQSLDDNEFLEVFPLSVAAAQEAIVRGEITDAKTIAALSMAQLHGIF